MPRYRVQLSGVRNFKLPVNADVPVDAPDASSAQTKALELVEAHPDEHWGKQRRINVQEVETTLSDVRPTAVYKVSDDDGPTPSAKHEGERCPNCGSTNLKKSSPDVRIKKKPLKLKMTEEQRVERRAEIERQKKLDPVERMLGAVRCLDCRAEWYETYMVHGYQDLKVQRVEDDVDEDEEEDEEGDWGEEDDD